MDILQFLSEHTSIYLMIVAMLSLFIGSFLNVVIYRLPLMLQKAWSEECHIYLGLKSPQNRENINLFLPLSHCPSCKKNIPPWHNIPILSYFLLKGKCAKCHAPFSFRYPFVECLTCLVSIFVAAHFGLTGQTLSALIFTWISICLIFIDLDYQILPDQLTLLLLWIGLVSSLFNVFCNSYDSIIGAIIGYLLFAIIQFIFGSLTGKTGMGQGDFKYLAALGAFLGWQLLPLILLIASVTGIIFSFAQMLIKQQFKSTPFPFGPYLAIAGWFTMFWGHKMLYYF